MLGLGRCHCQILTRPHPKYFGYNSKYTLLKKPTFCLVSVIKVAVFVYILWLKMAEGLVHTNSFKKFFKNVGTDSDSAGGERSASLPSKGVKSASTFYSYSSEDLAGCEMPSKCGWLFKQSRGVLRSWQVRYRKDSVY